MCVDFVYVVLEVESMVVFRDEGTTESTTAILSRESRSCEFTLLDYVF